MKKFLIMSVLGAMFIGAAAFAQTVDLDNCSVSYLKNDFVMFSLPGGGGGNLGSAYNSNYSGSTVDATITVTIRDANNNPIVGFPADKVLLKAALSPSCLNCAPFTLCTELAVADGPTNGQGITTFSLDFTHGGYLQRNNTPPNDFASMWVEIDGTGAPWLGRPLGPWVFVSPDLTGDGVVNLSDIGPYSTLFSGGYSKRIDFNADGAVNITDTGILAGAMASACQ